MALKLDDKKAIVAEVAEEAKKAISAAVADYRGLTVSEMTGLRQKARKTGVYLRVVRNTLARKALQDTEFACMRDVLKGPVFLALSKEDPGAAARLLKQAASDLEKLNIRALAIGGKLIDPKNIDMVASLPTRDQALAMLMQMYQAPIYKLVRTMAETYTQLVRTIAAIRDKKAA